MKPGSGQTRVLATPDFSLEKATYINFQKIDFVAIGGACAVFLRRIRPSGSGAKINFDKNYDSGPAGPDRGVVVTRETVIGSRQALHVLPDFPFYGFLRRPEKAPGCLE